MFISVSKLVFVSQVVGFKTDKTNNTDKVETNDFKDFNLTYIDASATDLGMYRIDIYCSYKGLKLDGASLNDLNFLIIFFKIKVIIDCILLSKRFHAND